MASIEEKGEEIAENKTHVIEGWLTNNEGMLLATLSENKICIEIGCFKGLSTVWISSTASKVYTMDTFEFCKVEEFKANTNQLKNVTLFEGDSHSVSRLFNRESIDFIFIDADHSYESVKSDILDYFPLLKIGGIIAFHDYVSGIHGDHPGVKKAVDEFFNNIEGMVDSTIWLIKKSNI